MAWREVVELFIHAERGLAAVHRIGTIHGDVKPANILVGRDGRVRLADFGMARMLGWRERGEPPPGGTRSYMAPERWTDAEHDAKADQFSFCVALWEALHGQRPRLGDRHEPDRAGLSADTIRRLQHGSLSASIQTLRKLGTGLGLSMTTLFETFELGRNDERRELVDLLAHCGPRELALVLRVVRALLDELGSLANAGGADG